MQCWVSFPFFSRFPPPWESRLPPPLLPPPAHVPPPFLPVFRSPCPPPHKMPRNETSKKKKTSDAISIHESFFPSKGGLKKYFCRTLCLHLKKLTPLKCDYINKHCPCHASRNLVLATYILVLFHNVTFVSLFAAK